MNDILKDEKYRREVLDYITNLRYDAVERLEHKNASMLRDVHVALRHYTTLHEQNVRKPKDTALSHR